MIKKLIIPIISFLYTIFWFMPVIFRTLREPPIVGYVYILAFIWFLFSWIIGVILAKSLSKDAAQHKKIDVYKVISIVSILCFYLIVISSFKYGTLVQF